MHRQLEMRNITNLLTSILWNNVNASAFGGIQWFLPCLFFTEIIFACLLKISRGNVLIIGGVITILSIVVYVIPSLTANRLPCAFDCALMASVFYGLEWITRTVQFTNKISALRESKAVS